MLVYTCPYAAAKMRPLRCSDARVRASWSQAPKDKLIAAQGAIVDVKSFPKLEDLNAGLPSPQWASDHALTTGFLVL